MKRTTILILSSILVITLAWAPSAWAWKKAYREGQKFIKVHAYEQAIEQFEEALKSENIKDKNREDVKKELLEAKQSAAEESFQRGLRFLEDNDLPKARLAFQKAKEYQPENTNYTQKFEEADAHFRSIAEKIEQSYNKGMVDKQWDQALKEMETYVIYESAFPNIYEKIIHLKEGAADYFVGDSDIKLQKENYSGAYNSIEDALKYSDKEELKNKKLARHHLLLSDEAWKEKKYLKAYEEIQKGLEFEPNHPELNKYQQRFLNEWAGLLYNEAMQANNDGQYATAKARLRQLSQFMPGYLNTEEMLEEISSTIAGTYYSKAEEIMKSNKRDRVGTALAYYLLVQEEHSPLYTDIEEKVAEAKKQLRKELEFRISVEVENKSEEPGAQGLVQEQILAKLKNSPTLKHVTILDREALDDILREQGLGQGFLDETTALEVKKIKGIQAGIKGEVIKVTVTESGRERPSYGSARYVSGTRWVPNPDYQFAQSDVQTAQQRVLQAQTDYNQAQAQQNQMMMTQNTANNPLGLLAVGLGGALSEGGVNMAKQDLNNAQARLAQTPAQIEEDVYADYRYEIFDLKLHGEIVIAFKVINYTTSEIGQVHTIRKEDSVNDRYIPGDPSKGVATDPNGLPTLEEFKNKLLAEAIDETFETLQKELYVSAASYFQLANKAAKNNIVDEAIENYMRYLYSAPDLSDPTVQEANEYIYEKFGLSVIRRKG